MKKIKINISSFDIPEEFYKVIEKADIFDSSSSKEAQVFYIDKGEGFYLKSASKNTLFKEKLMTEYLFGKGLSCEVLEYLSRDKDWLLTKAIKGNDCIASEYLENPLKLCDTIADKLKMLHSFDYKDCPIKNRNDEYLRTVKNNYMSGEYDKSHFPDSFGFKTAEEAWETVRQYQHLLKNDTLIHGDFCLPNIILDSWNFKGLIDVGYGGIGDRHIDIFWAVWSLSFNLKTDKYNDRFYDVYGRDNIDEDILRLISACEVFG